MAIRQALADADPKNTAWRRDVAVSLWKLADIEGGGVGWAEVAAAWEAMAADGVLLPPDRPFLEAARRRAMP